MNTIPPMHRGGVMATWLMAILVMTCLAGCANGGAAALSPTDVPAALAVKVYKRTTDGKHTYLALARDGELSFAGGRAAIHRQAKPIVTLTPDQRQEIWAIIVHHDLLATASQAFTQPEHVVYEVEIHHRDGQRMGRSFRVVDDQVPQGVSQLHDRLFELQGQVQYKPPQAMPAKGL